MLVGSVLFLSAVASVFASPIDTLQGRALPTPVTAATARTYLASLTVVADSNDPAYDRARFKHWHIVSGTCDTRETVLKRDGANVLTDTACKSTSGTWTSVYDNAVTTDASTFDIDHLVPLKEAWVSGARLWSDAQREAFANDLDRPQLLAVSASSNRAKGDKDPANWVPPLSSYLCTYVRAWVQVKYYYSLTVDAAEKAKLTSQLANC